MELEVCDLPVAFEVSSTALRTMFCIYNAYYKHSMWSSTRDQGYCLARSRRSRLEKRADQK